MIGQEHIEFLVQKITEMQEKLDQDQASNRQIVFRLGRLESNIADLQHQQQVECEIRQKLQVAKDTKPQTHYEIRKFDGTCPIAWIVECEITFNEWGEYSPFKRVLLAACKMEGPARRWWLSDLLRYTHAGSPLDGDVFKEVFHDRSNDCTEQLEEVPPHLKLPFKREIDYTG